jgi:hypothetical protein
MATAPYGVRLLVGAAVTALEETRRLPQTIVMYPMTVASQLAQLVLFPPKDEQPEWATFDEDFESADAVDSDDVVDEVPRNGERLTEGRFALYSTGEPETRDEKPTPASPSAAAPAIVDELGYESLTLAQLRARLPQLKVADLEALLAYEETTRARAPFQTLLANRITRATAK